MKYSFLQMFGLSVLISVWLIWGSNVIGDLLVPEPASVPASAASMKKPAPKAAAQMAAKTEENALAMLASADAGAGMKTFSKCKACHTTKKGAKNKIGPNLWGVVGRAKAGVPGFKYSGVLKGLGGAWTYAHLDQFLTSPKKFATGNKMTFAGLKRAKDRANVILYLRTLSDSAKPLP